MNGVKILSITNNYPKNQNLVNDYFKRVQNSLNNNLRTLTIQSTIFNEKTTNRLEDNCS